MSNYIYTADGLVNADELMHYGVPGMRWGHRKNKYITARQGIKNAKSAGKDAWRKATIDSGGKLIGKSKSIAVYKNPVDKMRGRKNARDAYTDAAKESVRADKNYNKQLRAEKKAERTPMSTKKKIVIGATVAGTVLAAYGAYKVSKVINKEHNKIMASKCRSWLSDIDRGVVNADADFVKGYFNGKSKDSFLRKLDTVATTHGTMKLKPGKLADAFDKRYMKLDEKEIRDILNPRHR